MAGTDFTLATTEESRNGAMACMDALRAIQSVAESIGHRLHRSDGARSISMDEYWRFHEVAVEVMGFAIGKRDQFTSGFVAAFAEYAFCVSEGGIPNLDKWRPEAVMTAEEKDASRFAFTEEVEGGRH